MINVVGALIKQNENFLVCQRAFGELKGFWEFPGGKIEKNEIPFEAIKREINEELGIKIYPIKSLGKFTHIYSFATICLTLIECEMRPKKQNIKSDGSHAIYAWVSSTGKDKKFAPLDEKILAYIRANS